MELIHPGGFYYKQGAPTELLKHSKGQACDGQKIPPAFGNLTKVRWAWLRRTHQII